jgi:putative acetyltransferase
MCEIVPYAACHREGVIRVVRAVYDEYGFTWEAEGYHRDLYEVERFYPPDRGAFYAMLSQGDVIGCVGVTIDGQACELHRMYLDSACRGRGLGRRLLEAAMDFGRNHGCTRMRAWSDVKLTLAHALYLKCGFYRDGERICEGDPDKAREYGFVKEPL